MFGQLKKMVQGTGKKPDSETKTWELSQDYEFEHAYRFMDSEAFRKIHDDLVNGRLRVSEGKTNELMLQEFFESSLEEWHTFVAHITGKTCLDIGPCVLSPLAAWDVAAARHIVEPLHEKIEAWQIEHLGKSAFEDLICHSQQAEEPVEALRGAVDGAILCRNMLDHTPQWPFVMQTMSEYAAPGCRLLLWVDLDHHGTEDIGHYNITTDVEAFKRLVQTFGFRIERTFQDANRAELNWGCFAIKE